MQGYYSEKYITSLSWNISTETRNTKPYKSKKEKKRIAALVFGLLQQYFLLLLQFKNHYSYYSQLKIYRQSFKSLTTLFCITYIRPQLLESFANYTSNFWQTTSFGFSVGKSFPKLITEIFLWKVYGWKLSSSKTRRATALNKSTG